MAAFAPIPSASDTIATTVTNGVLKSARSESLRLRMADGFRDLRRCKPIGLLSGSLQVDETLLLIRELTPSGWASPPATAMNGVANFDTKCDVGQAVDAHRTQHIRTCTEPNAGRRYRRNSASPARMSLSRQLSRTWALK